jgi:hypothetical protein
MSSSSDEQSANEQGSQRLHRAGAFDIRTFIAMLIGIYGVILVIAGLIGPSDAELRKADDLNINLWAGLGMVVVAAAFLLWARLRPVVVPEKIDSADEERPQT